MLKQHFKRLLLALTVLACTGTAWAATATFDFSDSEQLTAMGLAIPTSASYTEISSPITVDGVTLTPSTGTAPRSTYYSGGYTLYLLKNSAITLAAPNGATITDVTFTGRYTSLNVGVDAGSVNGLVWTGEASEVTFTATGSNTIYTIAVTYSTPEPAMTTVTGLGEFKALEPGTSARLYIPDANDCRVTYVSEDGAEVYLRDNTGAIMLDNVDANPAFKFNQHVAGWITGTYTNNNGMPKLVADDNTNTATLVIADPVTEADVTPVAIAVTDYDSHAADWVTASNLHVNGSTLTSGDNTLALNNLYSLGSESYYQAPHTGAIVDITGLAVPSASGRVLVPTYENGNRPITYVVDQDEDFVAPAASIAGTQVRLVRELVGGEWQTLAVPFNVDTFDGDIAAPQSFSDGVLTFATTQSIAAGSPVVVRPTSDVSELTFTGVTLASGDPVTNLGMTGIYRPSFMTGTTVLAMGSNGSKLVLAKVDASQLPTTHATFEGVGALLIGSTYVTQAGDVNLDGMVDITDVNAAINAILSGNSSTQTDVNGDGITDITDVNVIINLILSGGSNDNLQWRVKPSVTNNK